MPFALLLLFPLLAAADESPHAQLLEVRRVFIDKLIGENSAQIREMIIGSLLKTRLFVITENEQRADAFLRGAAEDLVFTDVFQTSESVTGRAQLGINTGTGGSTRYSSRNALSGSAQVGDNDSQRIQERKHEATAAVRLVNKEGDVIWSTTKESHGAKFRGAAADVAEQVAIQLTGDFQAAKKAREKPPESAPASPATPPR
jgi:hypothetical protein